MRGEEELAVQSVGNRDTVTPGSSARTGGRGAFFSIDRRMWAQVCDLGLNEAVAYLVLAQGTGRDNSKTSWSVTSLKHYAGISWERGCSAIERLIAAGALRHAEGHTARRPRYKLGPFEETVRHSEAAEADPRENALWLPNSIVTGIDRGADSPVRRLRGVGDVWALRLLVDLYHVHNLRDDGGISPQVIRLGFERRSIGQQGVFRLWAFKKNQLTVGWRGPLEAHRKRKPESKEEDHPVWKTLDILIRQGLLRFVPHLWENDSEEAEVLHPYGMEHLGGESFELDIGTAAHVACAAMARQERINAAVAEGFRHFAPVRDSFPNVQLIGVARLTHRPHTERTKAWFRELAEVAPKLISGYRELEQRGKASQGSQRVG